MASVGATPAIKSRSWRTGADSPHKRAEAAFRRLIEASPEAVLVYRELRVVYSNPAAAGLLGFTCSDEVVGHSALELTHPDDWTACQARSEEMQKTGKPAPVREMQWLRRDGSPVTVELVTMPLAFEGSQSLLVLGRDVSGRREHQARIELPRGQE